MRKSRLAVQAPDGRRTIVPVYRVHTLIVGSGAAGLDAAVQLHRNGIRDVLVLTEGLEMGTSINTGSDKQTYYKLAMCGADADAPRAMAETYFAGGSMHGDLALVEASVSARAFLNLVNLGVPFPRDRYGQFVGYKTDHDPRQRATSIGPYTSREMCRALIGEVRRSRIPIREQRNVVALITADEAPQQRACGAVAVNNKGQMEVYASENVVFATGGPGGLYETSVYPPVHTGGIGLALSVGAVAQSLPESQYGLASVDFRWNVSGTYMQVMPRFISTAPDGKGDPTEFLADFFTSPGALNSMVFLKGYQWPFDTRKAVGGSSLIDILVYIETVIKGRRVFLDFRANPAAFDFGGLSQEARDYLTKSNALQKTPLARLRAMNPGAVQLYLDHGIDLAESPLEVAVCAQHNNGGLAGNVWWESINIKHLFPIGEVNGSHGVYRPGGSALNAGQVGAVRAAEFIGARYRKWTVDRRRFRDAAREAVGRVMAWTSRGAQSELAWETERREFQRRMSRVGAHVRAPDELKQAVSEAWQQWRRIEASGCSCRKPGDLIEGLRNRHLCLAHAMYLDAVRFVVEGGVGSRGSALVLNRQGIKVHPQLGDEWRFAPENEAFREQVLETALTADGRATHRWVPRRAIPQSDVWFETAWAAFREGAVYGEPAESPIR